MSSRLTSALRVLPICALSSVLCSAMFAQHEIQLPEPADKPYTLHVYQNLVQIPSMVLNPLHGSYKGLNPRDFNLRLDSGPVFHPLHVRLEGDDPLAIALLLENAGKIGMDLISNLDRDAPGMPADMFQRSDLLSVSTAHCSRITSMKMVEASAATLTKGVTAVMSSSAAASDGCTAVRMPLWDVIGTLATRLQALPGRRVILVVSDGGEEASRYTWDEVRKYANRNSVTVLGIRLVPLGPPVGRGGTLGLSLTEDPFSMLCTGTGGIVLDANLETIWPQVRRMVALLRGRYILEFQRPVNSTSGLHQIDLAVKDKKAIVRVSGATVPLPDEKERMDPSTVPTDTSRAPVIGDRRILAKPY